MPTLITLRMRLPVCPFHSPLRTRLEKSAISVEHGMHLGHYVFTIDHDGCVSRRTQGNVQDCALLGDVDFLPVEHGIDSCSQTRFFRQLKKESERFIGDAVLGVIQVKTNGLDRQTLTALRIIRKKLPQMEL